MIWFTSDLHLGHRAAINMCGRPFETVEDEVPDGDDIVVVPFVGFVVCHLYAIVLD